MILINKYIPIYIIISHIYVIEYLCILMFVPVFILSTISEIKIIIIYSSIVHKRVKQYVLRGYAGTQKGYQTIVGFKCTHYVPILTIDDRFYTDDRF